MPIEEIEKKFLRLSKITIDESKAREILKVTSRLENLNNIGDLTALL